MQHLAHAHGDRACPPLDQGVVTSVLEKHQIDPHRPVLTQISRFDRLRDPWGSSPDTG